MRTWTRWAAAVVAVLALAGCSAGGPEPQAAGGDAAFPLTITHAQGTTTIPARPQRIVALSGEEDTLALLGITPAAFGSGYGLEGKRAPWLEGQAVLDGSTVLPDTQTSVNVEQIAALRPDLILATNLYGVAQLYPQLSGIAPTIGIPQGKEAGMATWQDLSVLTGRAVGQEAAARDQVARVEGRIAGTRAALPGMRGKTFSTNFYYEPGKFATVDSTDTGAAALLAALGMALAPGVRDTNREVSLEQVGRLDADFVAMGYAGDTLRADLQASPLYRNLTAVRDGHVYDMSEQAAAASNNPSIQNVGWQLDNFRPVLERAAAG